MQVAYVGDGMPRGGQQTAEPPETMETVEDDGSAGPCQEQSEGVDGTRSEHGALTHHKYNILVSEATEGVQANAGATGGEGGHGALEEERGKTPQRAQPAQEYDRRNTKARGPPEWSCTH